MGTCHAERSEASRPIETRPFALLRVTCVLTSNRVLYGSPAVLALKEVALSVRTDDQVLVRVYTTSITMLATTSRCAAALPGALVWLMIVLTVGRDHRLNQ